MLKDQKIELEDNETQIDALIRMFMDKWSNELPPLERPIFYADLFWVAEKINDDAYAKGFADGR